MATPQPVGNPALTIGQRRTSMVWALWIAASIVGSVLGALAAFEIRSLAVSVNLSANGQYALKYVATIASAGLAAGAQWWLLQRYRLDAYWWVPASVAAILIATIVIIPGVVGLFVPTVAFQPIVPSLGTRIFASAAALAAAGLVVGVAQMLVLRSAVAAGAWLWIPATVLGGALAGGIEATLSSAFLGLAPAAAISIAAATNSALTAACQAPVIFRILR